LIIQLDGSLSDYSASSSSLKADIITDIARECGILRTQVAVTLSAGSIVVVATLPSAGAAIALRKYQQKTLTTLGGLKVVNLVASQQMLLTAAASNERKNETQPGESSAKAIAGGIGGAVACLLLIVGAVIIRKTWRKLAEKDAAKPDASAHELQRKDRPDSIKLAAGAAPA
jgi:hypothetical protein